MNKKINTIQDTWKDLELLDDDVTNDELIERVNTLTEYVNYLYKNQVGI